MEKISLISRVRAGDRKAFDELCRKYYAMLVSYARLFLRDDWAEDVVQDVFYNVWQRRETLDDSNSLYKYLLRSVYNRSLNYLDKNRRAGEYGAYYRERIAALGSSYYAPDNSPVVQKLYNDDLRASLDAAIESLPPRSVPSELHRRPFEPRDRRATGHFAAHGGKPYVCGAQATAPETLQGTTVVAAFAALHAGRIGRRGTDPKASGYIVSRRFFV